jgi:putative copper resistance protein D
VLAAAVIAFRFLQYSGATILFGSSLFFVHGLPAQGPCAAAGFAWPRRLLAGSAALLLAAAMAGLVAQTGLLAGSLGEGFKPDNLVAVIGQMNFGLSAVARAGVAAILLACLIAVTPSRALWLGCAAGGAIACTSFAWMGHGAATEGPAGIVHLVSDIGHSLAAAVWIGALVAFAFLLLPDRRASASDRALYESLRRFSGIGSVTVALIVLTGLVNSWFLVGPDRLTDFWTTLYGQVLLAKLLGFAGMLGLAASNRYRLTPALGDALGAGASYDNTLSALRRSLIVETLVAFAVLGLVAWLGTLPPPSAR